MVTQNMLRKYEGKQVFSEGEKIRLVTALDLIIYLKQLKIQRLPFTCATIYYSKNHIL